MATVVQRSALLPYPPRDLFVIVNDVGRYPEFLPWCTEAEVHSSAPDEVTATLSLASRGLRESFTTRNRLVPYERIDLELVSGPFRHFRGGWRFTPLGESGCRVELDLEFQFGGVRQVLSSPFAQVFTRAADQLVSAFCVRAQTLLG